MKAYLDELLALAAANGVAGSLGQADESGPAEEPADPRMEAAYDAIEAGDWAGARAAYQAILDATPADPVARAGLALVGVLRAGLRGGPRRRAGRRGRRS